MSEIIGIIASVIGIATFIWGIYKFIGQTEYKKIFKVIDEHFQRWKESDYSSRGGTLIEYSRFLKINRFRSKFRKVEKDKMAFLLRNAVQNGMGGQWGKWLAMNTNNEKIVEPLILALDGTAGEKPMWRSAYILEKIFTKEINQVAVQLKPELMNNEYVKLAIEVIRTTGVEKYLENILQNKNEQGKRKSDAQLLLQEIEAFSKEIDNFTIKQSVRKVWLKDI